MYSRKMYSRNIASKNRIAISMFPDYKYPTASTLYFNDRSRRAALRRVMIRVSNLDGAPRETAHAAERPERSEKRPDRSGTGGFSLNYRTYATSVRVNHLTMPWDGRSSLTPFFPLPIRSNPFAPTSLHQDQSQLLMEMRSDLIICSKI